MPSHMEYLVYDDFRVDFNCWCNELMERDRVISCYVVDVVPTYLYNIVE